MANHVSFSIQFEEINDAAKAKWKELTDRLEQENYEYWMGDLWVYEGGPVSKEDVRQYSWTTEHVGPKWAYIQDFDDTGCSGYSAWSAPEEALSWILEQLAPLDPNLITSFYYDDEGPNFYGVYVYNGTEMEDGFEDDDEELRDRVFNAHPHLKEQWDEDEIEWVTDDDGDQTDESYQAEEEYRDVMYEVMHEAQSELVTETIQYIKDQRAENPVGC